MSYNECKNCIHSDVCIYPCGLKDFKDRSRFIELPCKIGDKVFSLVGKGEIEKWTVTDIYFSDFGVADINILQIKVRSEDKDKGASFPSHYLGRSFFYTYEEAKQALKERDRE